jgi:transcriptional regulator with XRE-family HTH domain
MATNVNDLETRLAERLKLEREARRWSIGELAERSGVSKAMISKMERSEVSPTAALLGRISAAYGLTLSTLLSRAEHRSQMLSLAASQEEWVDPATGFRRVAVSPPHAPIIEIVRGKLPAGAKIDYPAGSYTFIEQQILVLSGVLSFADGAKCYELRPGDCLALGSPTDRAFENRGKKACEYLVVIARKT